MAERGGRLRLVSWNVAGRTRRADEQAAALAGLEPDIVALQELRRPGIAPWRRALAAAGLEHAVSSDAPDAPDDGPRVYRVLVASRWPLEPLAPLAGMPWPERALRVRVLGPAGPLTVTTVHVPIGVRHGFIKIETFEALRAAVAGTAHPQILCGDLNSPRVEHPDGTVITFGQKRDGRLTRSRGERWDAGERGVLTGLGELGLVDVVRAVHGYGAELHSWYLTSHGRRYGFRLDHAFASAELAPLDARYASELREQGLSDHAPLAVDLAVPPTA